MSDLTSVSIFSNLILEDHLSHLTHWSLGQVIVIFKYIISQCIFISLHFGFRLRFLFSKYILRYKIHVITMIMTITKIEGKHSEQESYLQAIYCNILMTLPEKHALFWLATKRKISFSQSRTFWAECRIAKYCSVTNWYEWCILGMVYILKFFSQHGL